MSECRSAWTGVTVSKEFGDLSFAASLRDIIKSISGREARKHHPTPRYAQVVGFNRRGLTCSVLFPDSVKPLSIKMGAVQPQVVGQVVRVSPVNGDLFLEDVIGPGYFAGIGGVSSGTSTGNSSSFPTEATSTAQWTVQQLLDPAVGLYRTGVIDLDDELAPVPSLGCVLIPTPLAGKQVTDINFAVDSPSTFGSVMLSATRTRGDSTVELMAVRSFIDEGNLTSYESVTRGQVDLAVGTLESGDIIRFDVIDAGIDAKGLTVNVTFE